jgi:tyrosyl-tRNA synthetase
MSKSKGNYVGLSSSPDEIFGRLMSIPDHLVEPYLKQLTEWTDEEITTVAGRLADGTAHPMAIKRILAGEVTAALHGLKAAEAARAEFTARFSKRTFGDTQNLPAVSLKEHAETPVLTLLTQVLDFAPSNSAARRVAAQNGLRLIAETSDGEQQTTQLDEDAVQQPLSALVNAADAAGEATFYLKAGRKIARIDA